MSFQRPNVKKKTTLVPAGILKEQNDHDHYHRTSNSIRVDGIGRFAVGTRHYQNTFQIKEKHEKLSGEKSGVKFNIEKVPESEEKHKRKPKINQDDFVTSLKSNCWDAYRDSVARGVTMDIISIEKFSKIPNNLVYAGGHGFFAACLSAFAQHLPLAISPDHIWALITFAFANHVDKHAEELRENFVQHEGKKRLLVNADHMKMGCGDPKAGSTPETWEKIIFPSFSDQIKEHIGEKVHSTILANFSTTTTVTRAASEITLMSAMKQYFSYGMRTRCGIPNITLLGEEQDWVSLKTRTEALGKLMTNEFSKFWMPNLLPVLDEFVESYRGNVNHGFWQSMMKLRNNGMASGYAEFISGWIQIFFPYLKDGSLNRYIRPWNEMYFSGPNPNNIPAIVSSAPVDWDYFGTTYDLHFFAGFTGCIQDPTDGTLTPEMGWYVAHDPPKDPEKHLLRVEKEIEDLLKGHQDEVKDQNQNHEGEPWYERISVLRSQQKALKIILSQKK